MFRASASSRWRRSSSAWDSASCDHLLDLALAEARAALDLDRLLLAGAEVLRRDVQDAVGVDVERDLDLRHAAGCRRDPGELELAEALVVGGHLALALEHVDLHRGLVVLGGGEDLRLAGRDRRVALDQLREHASLGLDPERERRDVEQQHVLDVAGEHAGLDRCADRDDLVGVDALVRVLAGQLLDLLLHGGHAGHPADQHDVVDVGVAGVGQRLLDGRDDPIEQVRGQLVELRPGQLHVEMLRAGVGRRDERAG